MKEANMGKMWGLKDIWPGRIAMALVLLLWGSVSAGAFDIPTGNEDLGIRWDNTFRYNLGYRISNEDPAIIANPNLDDGDRNFKSGIVTNRIDVLSEFDMVYKKNYGIRLSAAGWLDQAYKNHLDNDSVATSNHFDANGNQALGLSGYVKRYYAGPDAEILDAFAFGNFDIMDIPFQVKAGRHTIYFGESLGLTAVLNGIAYAQSPLDIAKGYAVPGTSVKELFRPLNSVSATVHPASTFSITGQYLLEWESNRYPESGSYMGIYDYMLSGAESYLDPTLGRIAKGDDITPKNSEDWGVALRWSPEFLEGTIGLYYRNFSDKFPQLHVNLNPLMVGSNAEYNLAYASGIHLYGISVTRQLLGVSVGAEFSYRQNMPLASDAIYVASDATAAALGLPPGSYITSLPTSGETGGARGDTFHGVLNFLGLINKTLLFDSAQWTAEVSWNRWIRVSQNEAVFKGRDGYDGIDAVSRDAFTLDLAFTPTWFQVLPGVDLLMPLTYGRGLTGNAATGISNERGGYWSVGVSADILSRYRVDLAYVDYFGDYSTDSMGAVTVNNGDYALLKDRGTLSLTIKTTF
jgi:hypothetical protein